MEEIREAIRDIVRDGKRAGEVIARIRGLTKRTAPRKEVLDVNETIREVLAMIGDEAKRKSVLIRTQFADDLSRVSGDRVQLQQVVLNLVMNAMEAMTGVADRARELVIYTRNIDPDQTQVTVEDSGIGLAPNSMSKIFEPFLHHQVQRHGHGTIDQPFHRSEPWRPPVGYTQSRPRDELPLYRSAVRAKRTKCGSRGSLTV